MVRRGRGAHPGQPRRVELPLFTTVLGSSCLLIGRAGQAYESRCCLPRTSCSEGRHLEEASEVGRKRGGRVAWQGCMIRFVNPTPSRRNMDVVRWTRYSEHSLASCRCDDFVKVGWRTRDEVGSSPERGWRLQCLAVGNELAAIGRGRGHGPMVKRIGTFWARWV